MNTNTPIINNIPQKSQEQFWQEQIKLRQESGLSRAAYCSQHELICSRFSYWEHKLSPKPELSTPLVAVKLHTHAANFPSPKLIRALCSLELKDGHQF
jgi:hypothetical protein